MTLAIIFGLTCLLLPYFSQPARNKALLLSPIAFVGWFGTFYVFLFGLSIKSNIDMPWAPYLQQEVLFAEALPAYVAFCASAIIAQFFIMSSVAGRRRRNVPNKFVYEQQFRPALLLGASFAAAIVMWDASYLIVSIEPGGIGAATMSNKYLLAAVDLAIPGLSLMLLANRQEGARISLLVSVIICVALMFILLGSRYRLAMLATLLIASVTLNKGAFSRSTYITIALMLVLALPVMSLGRSYRSGFDVSSVLSASGNDAAIRIMNEGNIMLAMGAVSNHVPSYAPYKPLSPLLVAASAPIPRQLWEEKPEPDYLQVIPDALGSSALSHSGAALPIFGEWYIMGGIPAIIVIGVFFFFFLQRQFCRALKNGLNPLAACIACFCAYAYTRGYLAQTITAYFFIVLPALLAFKKKRGVRV